MSVIDRKDNIKTGSTEAVFENVGWIKSIKDTDQWWILLCKVMNFGVHKMLNVWHSFEKIPFFSKWHLGVRKTEEINQYSN
jgi:hypothetical protein